MKKNIIRFMAIAFPILITFLISTNLAFANTTNSQSVENTKEAAREVLKETGAKQIFGKSENGDRLIDNAKTKASQKLQGLADEADSTNNLTKDKQLFLQNLTEQD